MRRRQILAQRFPANPDAPPPESVIEFELKDYPCPHCGKVYHHVGAKNLHARKCKMRPQDG